MIDAFSRVLTDHTFQIVALATVLLGLVNGVLGVFLTLKRQSLLGDALGHSALPGIAIAFIIIQDKNFLLLLIGGGIAALFATGIIQLLSNSPSGIKQDAALALVLSSFFGLGTILITYIQRFPNASQAGIKNFIFGQASGMLQRDLYLIGIFTLLAFILIAILWKEFKLLSFDPIFAKMQGKKYAYLESLLFLLMVFAIVLGLESVGVVLISALLINPAVASRQWSDKLSVVVLLAAIFGGVSAFVGTLLSSMGQQIPTGPAIVLVISGIAFFSLIFAPKNGLLAKLVRHHRNQKRLLNDLTKTAKQGGSESC